MVEGPENEGQNHSDSALHSDLHFEYVEGVKSWIPLPVCWHRMVDQHPDSVLLQTSRFDASNRHSFLFLNPERILAARTLDAIPDLFQLVDAALAEGFYVAGFVTYECGYHFEIERFPMERPYDVVHNVPGLPLAWFGLYRDPLIFDHETGTT